jgi:hypothetical protein
MIQSDKIEPLGQHCFYAILHFKNGFEHKKTPGRCFRQEFFARLKG